MPTVYLIRHAEPVSDWDGDDDSRPLSDTGRQQARWMGEHLRNAAITELLTAPHARCRETAETIGQVLGLRPKVERALHIARTFAVNRVEGRPVWVAHSNNIPDALRALDIPCFACGHASAWKVELDDAGSVVSYEYIEPEV
jgi:broad specificity phosphatase PhoE